MEYNGQISFVDGRKSDANLHSEGIPCSKSDRTRPFSSSFLLPRSGLAIMHELSLHKKHSKSERMIRMVLRATTERINEKRGETKERFFIVAHNKSAGAT